MDGRWQLFASLENPPNDSLSLARLIMDVLANNCDLQASWGIDKPEIVELTQARDQLLILLARAKVQVVGDSRGVHQVTFLKWENLNRYKAAARLNLDSVIILVQNGPGASRRVVQTKNLQDVRLLDYEGRLSTTELSKSQRNLIFEAIHNRESRISQTLTVFSTAIKRAFPLKPSSLPQRSIPVWKPLFEVTKSKTDMAQCFSSVQTRIETLDQDMKRSLSVSSELAKIKSQQQELITALSQLVSDVRNFANSPKSSDLVSQIGQLEGTVKGLQSRINVLKKERQKKPEVRPLKLRCVKDQDGEVSLVVYNRQNRIVSTAQIVGLEFPDRVLGALPLKIEQFITVLPQATVHELGSNLCIMSADREQLSNTLQLDVQEPYIAEVDPKEDLIARTTALAKLDFPGSDALIQEMIMSPKCSFQSPEEVLKALKSTGPKPARSRGFDQK